MNLSSRQLTSVETAVLRYGLNFAPAPRTIPIPSLDLPESNKESVRATITNILKYSKPPTTSKLSRQQKLALKNMRKDDSITIIPAAKGKSIVIMDNDDYSRKINDLLNDKDTYLKITDRRRNPVSKVEKGLRKVEKGLNVEIQLPKWKKILGSYLVTLRKHPKNTILTRFKYINSFTSISMAHQLNFMVFLKSISLPYQFAPLLVVLTPYIQSVETLSQNIIPSYYQEIYCQK